MKSIALNFLKWKIKKNLGKPSSKRKNIPYSSAQTVGVLFSVADLEKHEAIKHFVHLLEKDKKNVTVLSYLGEQKENFEFRYDYFNLADLSFFGQLKSESAEKFAKQKFDFLFHLDPIATNPLMDYILSECKALCRVGIKSGEQNAVYELVIKPEQDKTILEIVEEVYRYTKALSK